MRAAAGAADQPNYIGTLIGLSIDEVEVGEVSMSLHTRRDMANPLGTLHGGICATLLDSAMGCAVHTTLEAGVGYGTLELKVNYIRSVPVDGVKLTATAKTIHVGRKTATAEGRVHDPQGRLVAHGTTTCMIHR
jgi:acyl-CoA thioesterase